MSRLPFLSLLFAALFAWQCNAPSPQSRSVAGINYTVTGADFTINGKGAITVTIDGKVVWPVPTDTSITNPPVVDTSAGRDVLFGVNTNHYQPKDQQAKLQGVRYYLPLGWVWTEAGFYGQPMKQGQKQFLGVDDYLTFMKSKGVDVLLDLMQSPDWLNGQSVGVGTNDWPPIRPGLDRENPASYAEIALAYKAFAMRYGAKVWPVGSYKVDPAPPRWTGDGPQAFKSGLNLVRFIEVGNELDRWWDFGTPRYMTPKEHVAFLLAVYDAIKAADPSIMVVMAGLTNYDLKYLTEMKAECDARGRKFPADVINVHHYSSSGNLAGVHPPNWPVNSGCAPELDKDMNTLAKIVAFAASMNLPTWVTEYGYDTTPGSQLAPVPFAGMTTERLQSDWNVRSALEHIRLGAARSYVFTMADEPSGSGSLFQSSGLLRGEPAGYAEKVSFPQFVDLSNQLRGFKYLADQSTATARVLKFRHPDGRVKFAFWSPTASGKTFGSTIAGTNVNITEFVQFLSVQNHGQPVQ